MAGLKTLGVQNSSTVLTTGMVYDSLLVALAASFTISLCTPLEAVINLLPPCTIGVLRDLFTVLCAETGSNLHEQKSKPSYTLWIFWT